MKTKLIALIALGSCLFLAGCETADELNKLSIGMTKQEVISMLGQPESMSAQGNVEYLTYYLATPFGDNAPNNINDKAYMVRLVNDKVESFGRYSQLLDLYYRPVNGQPGQAVLPLPGGGAMVPGAPSYTAPGLDIATQLQKLAAMKQQGLITDEEYEAAKKKILGD